MRLIRVDIDGFRSIEDQWLPANGLVVLFGANSAGKSSVLEAVAEVITQAEAMRSDPGQFDDEYVMGSITFTLPDASSTGTQDAQAFASLLSGEQARSSLFGEPTYPWPWLGEELRPSLRNAKVGQARAILATALAEAGSAGTARDRRLLASAVFSSDSAFFTADAVSTHMSVYRPAMPAAASKAARRIAAAPAGNGPLHKIAVELESEQVAHIGQVGGGTGKMSKFSPRFRR